MSRRTAEASRAIREAWEHEQQLVSQGKGTRDWTPEQQKSIIEIGKVYDEDGRSFIGHHMKSAECFPEYQGDPENIQFLSFLEHLQAHDGNWRNPTNWYYDPLTGIKHDFGDNKYEPCKIIELSTLLPVSTPDERIDQTANKPSLVEEPPSIPLAEKDKANDSTSAGNASPPVLQEKYVPKKETRFWEKAGDFVVTVVEAGKNYIEKNPGAIKIIGKALAVGAVGFIKLLEHSSSRKREDRRYRTISSPLHQTNSADDTDDYDDSYGADEDAEGDDFKDHPDKRSSPIEHDVSSYDRQQNGKIVHVKPYKRGRK